MIDMNNNEKAKEIAEMSQYLSDFPHHKKSVKYGAMEIAQWKDEQLDSAIDKALQRNGDFLKQGKITQYGYDIAFATIQNIREYLKQL